MISPTNRIALTLTLPLGACSDGASTTASDTATTSPDATDNIRGRLMQDEVITALEHRPGWVRHDKGWSVSRVRGDSWLWLVPEHPQEIAAGVQIIEGSDNTLSPGLLMHSPSAQASAAARAAFEAAGSAVVPVGPRRYSRPCGSIQR